MAEIHTGIVTEKTDRDVRDSVGEMRETIRKRMDDWKFRIDGPRQFSSARTIRSFQFRRPTIFWVPTFPETIRGWTQGRRLNVRTYGHGRTSPRLPAIAAEQIRRIDRLRRATYMHDRFSGPA